MFTRSFNSLYQGVQILLGVSSIVCGLTLIKKKFKQILAE